MNYLEFIKKCWENHRLLSLMFELTFACQFKCPFCYNEKQKNGKRLNLEKYKEILEDGKKEGALYLTLTGGEPTLSKIFFPLCKIANNLNYSIRIKSNGYNWDSSFVKRLKEEVSPYNVDLSIHGAKDETFDKITGINGSFKSFLKTIENLKKENIRIVFKFPVNSINEEEIEDVFALSKKLNIKIEPFADLAPKDDGSIDPIKYSPSKEGIKKMYENLINENGRKRDDFFSEEETDNLNIDSDFVCGAGISSLTIDPFGNVYPCVAWRRVIGNLWKKSLKEIWHSKEAEKIIKVNKRAMKRKRVLKILKGEFFCLGRAEVQYKNPLTIYPDCLKVAIIRKKVLKNFT
jgi:MoaA/NifB/PqqE/SkfB family radical SAM enzyme